MRSVAILETAWREPAEALNAWAEREFALGLLSSGGRRGRWSYLMADPAATLAFRADDPRSPFQAMRDLLGPREAGDPDGPPFQGGLAGLLTYELGSRVEPVGHFGHPDWPLLACGLYLGLLAFDHQRRRVLAIGRGADDGEARSRAEAALELLRQAPARASAPGDALTAGFEVLTPGEAYEASVADIVERIAAGEIFQANIARAWGGRLAGGARPADLALRLVETSPAPFCAYFRLPGRAVVSNSPERFLSVDEAANIETRPIKGTRPRGPTPALDLALRQELIGCEKDRAENLMIVDLMRNDISRVCPAGTVRTPELFTVESFANVHHLVSTVTGRLKPGLGCLDALEAAFPPGSITGAPKVQAIKVIAEYEGPRGPYCGSMFWAGFDGAGDSSVLIRTAAFTEEERGWRFEARAGAGIVADSDPHQERLETEAKIDALRRAFVEPARLEPVG
jgi:para-aminobenzoate synthetase component 1